MRRKIIYSIICFLSVLCLGACNAGSANQMIADAATGQAMLNSASTWSIKCHGHSVNKRCDLVVDNQTAGQLQESGFFDAHWNILAGGEEWFYAKYVTGEWINNVEGVVSATTYGIYDMNDNCLGYCQERVMDGDYWYVFLNADGTERGLYMDENGSTIYSYDGTVLATANYTIEDYRSGIYNMFIMPANGYEPAAMDKLMMFIRLEWIADDLVED